MPVHHGNLFPVGTLRSASFHHLDHQLSCCEAGGKGDGKKQIAEYRPGKGYRDGLAQGRINLARELSNIADKHLVISLKPEKQNNSVSQKQYQKFMELLHGEKDGSSDEES